MSVGRPGRSSRGESRLGLTLENWLARNTMCESGLCVWARPAF